MKNKATLIMAIAFGVFAYSNANAQTSVVAVGNDSICPGDTSMLAASFMGSSSATFTWIDTTGANSISSSSGDTVSVYPSTTTHYQVIGDTNGTKDTVYFTVTIRTLPSVTLVADSTGCFGDSLMLVGTGASSYEWYSTLSFPASFASGDTVYEAPINSRTYWVDGTDAFGCMNSDTMGFVVKRKPRETYEGYIKDFKLSSTTACTDEVLTLKTSVGTNSYKWSSSGTISDTVGSEITTMIVTSQTIIVRIDSSNGCSSTIQKTYFPFSVKPAISYEWMGDSVICSGDTTMILARENNPANKPEYRWSPAANFVDPDVQIATVTANATTALKVEAILSGCVSELTMDLTVLPLPDISLSQSSGGAPICKDAADTITITSNAGVLFDWGFGVISSAKVKAVAPGETTTMEIIAYSSANCSNTASITINVDTSCGENLSVPSFDANSEIKTFFVEGNELNLQFGNVPTGNVTVQVLNLTGAAVLEKDLGLIEAEDETTVEVYDLKSGIYLLRIVGDDYEVVNKILK